MATDATAVARNGRTAGYVGTIVVNAVLIYAARNLLAWDVPFVTPVWADVLWAVELSLYVAIVGAAVLLSYDAAWFRHLVEAVQGAFALQAGYWIWTLYPFDFGAFDELARLMTLLV